MKKQILFLLSVLLTSLTASAYEFEVDGFYYNTVSIQDLTCEITASPSNNKYSGDVVIPSTVTYRNRTLSVVRVGSNAFNSCSNLRTVVIPNSVTSIGDCAFYYCTNLTSVEMGCSVTMIEQAAFYSCYKLTSAVIPNTVTSIGSYAFWQCTSLTSVMIPNSVKSMDTYAFANCSSLASVVLSDSITAIEESVFLGCSSLTSIDIPGSVTIIRSSAFQSCTSLESVVIPNSVITLNNNAFRGCTSLASVVIPEYISNIPYDTFFNCSALTEIISMSPTPPVVGSNAFSGVSRVESTVKVPADAVGAYMSADVWKDFWEIVALTEGDVPEPEKCAEPTIEIVDGELVVTSATEGAACYTAITSSDTKSYDGNGTIQLSGVYTITSYAHAEGYTNSETVTANLIWVNPAIEGSGVLTMEAKKAVLIHANGGQITISGTERGESVRVYTADGRIFCAAQAEDGETTISGLRAGEIVIVSYGGKSVKVAL